MSNPVSQEQLAAAIATMKQLSAAQQKEVAEKAGKGSAPMAIHSVMANISHIRETLPCFSELHATAMLGSTEALAGASRATLTDVLVPYLDEHYEVLRNEIPRIAILCQDRIGQAVIDRALTRVRNDRRKRGASEVATLDALLQVMNSKREAAGEEAWTIDNEKDIDAVLTAYKELTGHDVEESTLGGFSARDLGYLRDIKKYLAKTEPRLSDPMNGGSSEKYFRLVLHHLEWARKTGMDPETRANAARIKAERAKQPNALFTPLDGRGAAKWGGTKPNVQTTSTRTETLPDGTTREVQSTTDGPENPFEGIFGNASISDLYGAVADAHERVTGDKRSGGDLGHLIP